MNGQEWTDANGHPTPENWHEFYLSQIEHALEHGLDEAYGDDVIAFLCDLNIGDVPWTEPLHAEFSANVEADPRLADLRARFVEKFGEDFWGDPPPDEPKA